MMFSATWPTGVQQLAANFMTQPVKVVIGSQDLAASHSITQVCLPLYMSLAVKGTCVSPISSVPIPSGNHPYS